MVNFDLELFLDLNEEYREKPLVRIGKAPSYDPQALRFRGSGRASQLNGQFNVAGKRTLEVGCGMGETSYAFASEYGCKAYGVDIDIDSSFGLTDSQIASWKATRQHPNLSLRVLDISTDDYSQLGQFDFICSFTVWEHMMHPFSALKACKELLKPNGFMFMVANLYRGPKASHMYREVFFPFPHLLFQDSVFQAFYDRYHPNAFHHVPPYVNKLTAAEYLTYFQLLGFRVDSLSYSTSPIDEDFYQRFHDILSKYPRFDLERDFITVTLSHDSASRYSAAAMHRRLASTPGLGRVYRRVRRMFRA